MGTNKKHITYGGKDGACCVHFMLRLPLLLSRCFTSTETVWLISDGGKWDMEREPRPTSLFTTAPEL